MPEGAHDFDDYDSNYEEQHPELGFTDEQVEAEVAKLDPDDKKFYEEYRGFLDTYDHQHGKIIEMPDLIKRIIDQRAIILRSLLPPRRNKTNCGTN